MRDARSRQSFSFDTRQTPKPLVRTRQNRTLLFFLAVITFVAPIAYAAYDFGGGNASVDYQGANIDSPSLSPTGRMLVILLDSGRKDFVFSDRMPFTSGLRKRGAWGISEVVSVPITVTGSRAMFSGALASPLAIFEDYQPSATTSDNLFNRVSRRGWRAVIFSESLLGVYGRYTDLNAFKPRRFLFSQFNEESEYIFEKAYRFLKEEHWDLAVVPFYSLDYVGHLETPLSPNYLTVLRQIDDYVRQLVGLTSSRDVVLITAEHGMDDRGFHVDRTEMVMETPFILLGPDVEKGGPRKILQIDWSPTLSILAGVSPFYESPALPALDLLNLPSDVDSKYLRGFSQSLLGASSPLTLDELRAKRMEKIGRKGSPLVGVLVALSALLSVVLFSSVALFYVDYWREESSKVKLIAAGVVALCLLSGIWLYSGFLDSLFDRIPFSANFIKANPLKVALALAFVVLLPMLGSRMLGKMTSGAKEASLLLLYTLFFAGIFLATNPYHPLNWVVLSIPLLAFGITRLGAWIAVFGAVLSGLAIRRLTFYNVFRPIDLPDRWLLAALVLVAAMAFLWWRLRDDRRVAAVLGPGVLCFALGIAAIALSSRVEVRALLLILLAVPVALLVRREPGVGYVWWALWVVFFYLGTSSNINHATHIVALPLLIAVWSASRETSAATRGVMVAFVVWAFYLMPGNGFDLKLLEMNDRFILASAISEHIEFTVFVIMCRFILPAAVLLWGMERMGVSASLDSIVSVAILPVVFGTGANLAILMSSSTAGLPWEQLVRLAVMIGFFVDLIAAYLIVAALSKLSTLLSGSARGAASP